MAEITYNIYEIEPNGLSGFKALPPEDESLITSTEISKTFKPNDNFIELSFYTLDNTRLETIPTYDRYSILSGDRKEGFDGNSEIGIDVQGDYLAYGYGTTEGKVLYNFLDYPYSNTALPQDFYIESISNDRTELRLVSVNLDSSTVLDTTNGIKAQFDGSAFIPDFHLYFGNNIFFTIVNIDAKPFRETTAVIIKLLEPLPRTVGVKATLNIVEKVSDSIAYEINNVITPDKEEIPTLRGANFSVDLNEQATEPSQYFNYNELFSFASYNSYREINSLFNEKGAELGIDYSDFANFINFSSAEERLRNFKYKLELIESYQTNLDNIQGTTTSPPLGYTGTGVTGTTQYWKSLIEGIINNFDHYERHLFYENETSAWPKVNSSTTISKPYQNLPSTNGAALAWYNAELQDAILYDSQNGDLLTNTVPSYLIEDSNNRPYELIVHMVAQHFDNIWIYTNQVSEKYDADNRLDRGVSKDLIEELLKNFGVKLYTSNKSVEDLFRYFTTNSYDKGQEYIPAGNLIKAFGQESVSQNDYQKEIYKRIYHNLPLLMKSKGTERGLRALINCFGIPSDVLKVRVFGGESSGEFPFFGGQQDYTGSIDKVRLSNTGSIVPGDTVSFYTSVINQNNEYTADSHRIEVGFSPAYNVNEYIVSQSAVLFPNVAFNIDDYIGDPRGYETNKYPPLYAYAETILANIDTYNLKDFVRLIKFFDNVLFRMIRDFTPARAVTDAGIIIKPHLLDRSKFKSPEIAWTQPEYSGSIDTAFTSGSNAGAFKNIGAGSTNGESDVNYFRYTKTPFGSRPRRINFESTQIEKNFQEAKFDGELANSRIRVTNGELNEDNPFKNLEYPDIRYNVEFLDDIPDTVCILTLPTIGNNLGEFVISEVPQIINIPASDIFYGDTATAYTFTVGEGAVSEVDNISHNFNGEQYDTFEVGATHTDENLTLPNSDDICKLDRTVRIVKCKLSPQSDEISSSAPTVVTIDTVYDLYSWFFPPNFNLFEPTNRILEFYVDGEFIGTVENGVSTSADSEQGPQQIIGTHPRSYIFTNIDQGASFTTVEIRDAYNQLCKVGYNAPFDACPLVAAHQGPTDTRPFITDPETDILTPNQVASPSTLLLNFFGDFWTQPFGFANTTPTTKFYFRLLVDWEKDKDEDIHIFFGPGPFPDADPELLPLSNETPHENGSSWREIPATSDLGTEFLLARNYFASTDSVGLINTLDEDGNIIGEGDFPESEPRGLAPEHFYSAGEEILQPPPTPNTTSSGPLNESRFKRYIQFLAVTNQTCREITPFYQIEAGEIQRRAVTLIVNGNIYNSLNPTGVLYAYDAQPICSLQPEAIFSNQAAGTLAPGNSVTVYVNAVAGDDQITPTQVINNKLPIFLNNNPNDNTPAKEGWYGRWFGDHLICRRWRVQDDALPGASPAWDSWSGMAENEQGSNWAYQDYLANQAGYNPGLIVCDGGATIVDDGDGVNDNSDGDSTNTGGGGGGGGKIKVGFN